ncbi:MAG: Bug family tripartite tricarboxylate transporter substrate binding protein [Polaromonas sp.]|uniref:Bug family tripartite tricarboxylate transporter substrate binding protein n=1 Tax=Polaromonas sp. TaxID=1869339 RepID=UPI002732E295|nr:Bug family tripartite tricarboxylate transporter substrate binding protein [Polaromonas sp.]MDP2820129.1 Bug family tripartite tricarboxylate transporter substrate binding protein [Polaromonas sp.]
MTTRRHFVHSASAFAAFGALSPLIARAQALDQVKIINGFPAGGTADATSRRVGEQLRGSRYTSNAAVVENKPGAGGRIACETVKNAAPDGRTLLLTPFSCTAVYPHIYTKLSYDPFKDLMPVSIAAVMHHGLAVGPLVPSSVRTVKDYVAWCKANPNQASYGSPAAGSLPHFLGALLGSYSGVALTHVPYRGSIPGVADLVGGQLASMFTPSGDFLANHKAGKIRMIATSGPARSPFSPEVPTFAEQGFSELTTEEWFGFYAPAKTPDTVIDNANAAINAALKIPTVISGLATFGLVPAGSTVREMDRSQREAYFRWGPLVKHIGFTGMS